jgi:hypothetical protein
MLPPTEDVAKALESQGGGFSVQFHSLVLAEVGVGIGQELSKTVEKDALVVSASSSGKDRVDLDFDQLRTDKDGRGCRGLILTRNGEVIQSVNPDVRIRGQRSTLLLPVHRRAPGLLQHGGQAMASICSLRPWVGVGSHKERNPYQERYHKNDERRI